jgi:hypothetical protein
VNVICPVKHKKHELNNVHCSIHVFMFYWTYYIQFTSTVTLFNTCFFTWIKQCNSAGKVNVICPLKHKKTWIEKCNSAGKVNVICPIHFTRTVTLFNSCFFMFYWTYYIHFTSTVTLFNSCFYTVLVKWM